MARNPNDARDRASFNQGWRDAVAKGDAPHLAPLIDRSGPPNSWEVGFTDKEGTIDFRPAGFYTEDGPKPGWFSTSMDASHATRDELGRNILTIEDSSANRGRGSLEKQGIYEDVRSVPVDGFPVAEHTARTMEDRGLLPEGYVDNATPVIGWTRDEGVINQTDTNTLHEGTDITRGPQADNSATNITADTLQHSDTNAFDPADLTPDPNAMTAGEMDPTTDASVEYQAADFASDNRSDTSATDMLADTSQASASRVFDPSDLTLDPDTAGVMQMGDATDASAKYEVANLTSDNRADTSVTDMITDTSQPSDTGVFDPSDLIPDTATTSQTDATTDASAEYEAADFTSDNRADASATDMITETSQASDTGAFDPSDLTPDTATTSQMDATTDAAPEYQLTDFTTDSQADSWLPDAAPVTDIGDFQAADLSPDPAISATMEGATEPADGWGSDGSSDSGESESGDASDGGE